MTAGFDIQDLPQERPRRTRRRPPSEIGAVVLVVLVLVVAVLAGIRPRIVPGSADPSPSALLPPAGGCLHWDVDPDAQSVPISSTVVSVDCSQLHEGQVVQAWRSGRLPPSSTIQQICRAPRSSTVSVGDDWSFALAGLQAGVVSTGSGPLDFLACV
ncbi:MAG: hypothetical protein INR72_10285, partial [Williamsia herbipolensis]|nr:hypothetical protein [Williamsia herbipolensis]